MADFFSKPKRSKVKTDGQSSKSAPKIIPWVEKYRPKQVTDVAYQNEVVAVLQNTVKGDDFPNLLFYGPPGTGKTSTILAVCRQLFGHDLYKSRTLELNASDERGIQVVRDKVKTFASQSVSAKRPDGTPCPPFKIVILDEADSMTKHAQAALRRTMEKQTKTTRFCLICNYVSRIIEPITSRCAKFRFKPLSIDTITERLAMISKGENVKINNSAIDTLIKAAEGDMRKAITFLQSAHRLKAGEEEITSNDIVEMAGIIPAEIIESLTQTFSSGSFDKLDAKIKEIMMNGYSGSQLVTQIHDSLVESEVLNDNQKAVIMEKLSVVDKCLCDGADEYLQIMAAAAVIMEQFNKQ
eukprot:TCONS_00046049-protein